MLINWAIEDAMICVPGARFSLYTWYTPWPCAGAAEAFAEARRAAGSTTDIVGDVVFWRPS